MPCCGPPTVGPSRSSSKPAARGDVAATPPAPALSSPSRLRARAILVVGASSQRRSPGSWPGSPSSPAPPLAMLPPRASILALALLAAALATTAAQEAMPAAAAAPAPEGMAAAAPAPEAENPLVSQYRLSPEQVAVLESLGLTDPQSIMVSGCWWEEARDGKCLPDSCRRRCSAAARSMGARPLAATACRAAQPACTRYCRLPGQGLVHAETQCVGHLSHLVAPPQPK